MWDVGRQNSGYYKKLLFQSNILKCDLYLIKIPGGISVPEHVDPAPSGMVHWRFNVELGNMDNTGRIEFDGKPKLKLFNNRIVLFAASKILHKYIAGKSNAYFLSFGILLKEK